MASPRGIQIYHTASNRDVVRIDTAQARSFVLGSHMATKVWKQGTPNCVGLLPLDSVAPPVVHGVHSIVHGGKTLKPVWISNGAFCGGVGIMATAIVDQGSAIVDADMARMNRDHMEKRWMYSRMSGTGMNVFWHQSQLYTAQELVDMGHFIAIGGSGALVENGKPHKDLSNYWNSQGTGNFGTRQYSTSGPIIAMNDREPAVLYLILNRMPLNLAWHEMAAYLANSFLSEINRPADGKIRYAFVNDGGGSRQLWLSGQGIIPAYHDFPLPTRRHVPHFICLWA